MREKFQILLNSINKTKRAKKKAVEFLHGTYDDQYAKLESYAAQLKISDPNAMIKLVIELDEDGLERYILFTNLVFNYYF